MARRMAGVGLVTVSLRRSITKDPRSYKFGKDFIGEHDASRRQAKPVSGAFDQAVRDELLDGGGEGGPVRFDAFVQAKTEEERFAGRRGCALDGWGNSAGVTVHVLGRGFGILPARGAVEGMRVGAEAQVGLAPPVFQIVARFESGTREIGDLVPLDSHARQALSGDLVEVGDLVFRR